MILGQVYLFVLPYIYVFCTRSSYPGIWARLCGRRSSGNGVV